MFREGTLRESTSRCRRGLPADVSGIGRGPEYLSRTRRPKIRTATAHADIEEPARRSGSSAQVGSDASRTSQPPDRSDACGVLQVVRSTYATVVPLREFLP